MRTLQLISPSGPYGAESMMINLAEALGKQGCTSVLAIFQNSRNPSGAVLRMAARAGLPVEIIPCDGRIQLRALARLKDCIERNRIDIVHSHGPKTNFYSYLAARTAGIPIVGTYHSGLGVWESGFKWGCCRIADIRLLRRFDRVVAVSKPIWHSLWKSGICGDRLSHISNGVNLALYTAALSAPAPDIRAAGRLTMGFIGRIVEGKGVGQFFQAASQVLQRFPNTVFYLIGSGPLQAPLEKLAKDSNLSGRIVFTGTREDMPSVYAALDTVVLPSLREGLPMTILEALAAKCAVIATEVGGIPTVIRHGETGLLIPPGDAVALERAMLQLAENPDLGRQLGRNGYRVVEAGFSSEAMARQYLMLYAQLLSSQAAPAHACPFDPMEASGPGKSS
jgi:glycosyltransferase involved in cell wall biosynthesis